MVTSEEMVKALNPKCKCLPWRNEHISTIYFLDIYKFAKKYEIEGKDSKEALINLKKLGRQSFHYTPRFEWFFDITNGERGIIIDDVISELEKEEKAGITVDDLTIIETTRMGNTTKWYIPNSMTAEDLPV